VKNKVTATLLTKDADGHYCSTGGNQVYMHLKESTGEIKDLNVVDNVMLLHLKEIMMVKQS